MNQINSEIPEIWGGIECTINRVNNDYFDQLSYSGHYDRLDDLSKFADLGIKKLRYPVLWEKHQPFQDTEIDWQLTENKLLELQRLSIEPIVGLVHHGSGPLWVNMLDDSFALGLARFASETAAKFPWINYYTPVNEPLTTARFCGLYGHWFPHKQDYSSFVRILINECKATVLAMLEIRKINPKAKLVQTDDLGRTHSTEFLQYQADFENHRKWLAFDLLCAKVDQKHAMWTNLTESGITASELEFFILNPCPPDIIGLNYYITSERYLDQNLEYYPSHTYGGNGKHEYADVEAVRVGHVKTMGIYKLMEEAWNRYKIPIALTEVHLHCTREEQLRWLKMISNEVIRLRKNQIDVVAITFWALLGSFGWDQLLTQPGGNYESGVFDVRSGSPRPTVLAKMIGSIASNHKFVHPVLSGSGWWESEKRIIYKHQPLSAPADVEYSTTRPIIIIGKSGALANGFARICNKRNIRYEFLSEHKLSTLDQATFDQYISHLKPWAIVNAADFGDVDAAENNIDLCFKLNADVPDYLAFVCARLKIKFLMFSSDFVFDGVKNDHYQENDEAKPLNVYGQSKLIAEQRVLRSDPTALVIRTGPFFGPWDKHNFVSSALSALHRRRSFTAANDVFSSPTYLPDLIHMSLDLLLDDESGIWHLANSGAITWSVLAEELAQRTKFDSSVISAVGMDELGLTAQRPKYSALKSNNGFLMPSLENAIDRYLVDQEFVII